MEKYQNQKELEKYFVSKDQHHKDISELYANINKKSSENRDRIDRVDAKHMENFYEQKLVLERNTASQQSLDKSVKTLNQTIENMSGNLNKNANDIENVAQRVGKTEVSLTEKQKAEEARKAEVYKMIGIIIPSLLGAGGLMSWLGPLLFK